MKNSVLLLVLLVVMKVNYGQVKLHQQSSHQTVRLKKGGGGDKEQVSKDQTGKGDKEDIDSTKSSSSGSKGGEGYDRVLCDIKIAQDKGAVTIDKKMIEMKYMKGKLVMVGKVDDQGDKECELLDMNKCQSLSRNHLGKSIFFKTLNIGTNQVRFSFNFFIGVSRELGLCSIRVAMKTGEDTFEAQEKVMSYFPQELFNMKKLKDQKSFSKGDTVFEGKSTQEALEICAKPLESDQKMFVSNFYQTFEGFLLAESQKKEISLKCEKSKKMKEVQFSTSKGDLKKVDVFVDNQQYTKISIKGDDKTKVGIEEKKVDAGQKGDNLAEDVKLYSFKVYGQSYYNYNNNNCYDLDMKHVARSFSQSTFTNNFDNNVLFTFDAVAMAVETTQGAMCAVYSVAQGVDKKFYVQNDMLVKFKKKGIQMTNQGCGQALKKFNCAKQNVDLYNSHESRFLAGAVLNSMMNAEAKIYCQVDISDNVSLEQYRQDQYSRIFYENAKIQFIDNNNQDATNTAITAQIEAAKKNIKNFQEKESEIPIFHKLPFDFWTRKDVTDTLKGGSVLANNQFLRSKNGLFQVIIERDNNFVLYMKTDAKGEYAKLWASSTANGDVGKGEVKMGDNGQMQIVNNANQVVIYKTDIPSAGSDFFMIMQNDGNLVIYNSLNQASWSTNTCQINNYFSLETDLIPTSVENGFQHYFGMILRSSNKQYILQLDQSGSLQVKKVTEAQKDSSVGQITWENYGTCTDAEKFNIHIKFVDGNLVQYKDLDEKVEQWSTNTAGKGGVTLILEDDGNLQILGADKKQVWIQSAMVADIWTQEVSNILKEGETIESKQFLRSKNNRFLCIMQFDKNLVVYEKTAEDGSKVSLWSSKTSSTSVESLCKLTLGANGIFTITDQADKKQLYTSTNSGSGKGYQMVCQNDGNLVVYNSEMTAVFNTDTEDNTLLATKQIVPSELQAPFTQNWGYLLMSTNKKFMLTLSATGDLEVQSQDSVMYKQSITGVKFLEMSLQLSTKGQLELFADTATSSWNSNSEQKEVGEYKLWLTDAGALQVVDKSGKVIWDPSVMNTDIWASKKSLLKAGETLANGASLVSLDGLYAVVMQPDNNLVVYLKTDEAGDKKELWSSKTTGGLIGSAILKIDGKQLVIQDSVTNKQTKLLSTANSGSGYFADMQVDGNFVFYNSGYSAFWASGTNLNQYTLPTTVLPYKVSKTKTFTYGQTILRSQDKKSYLMYYYNGQIQLFREGQTTIDVTSSGKYIKDQQKQFFILQNDGNLVFYLDGAATWDSSTVGSGETLQLSNGGKLQLLKSNGEAAWTQSGSRRFQSSHFNTTHHHHSNLQLKSQKINKIKM